MTQQPSESDTVDFVYEVTWSKLNITVTFVFNRIPTEDEFNKLYFEATAEVVGLEEPPIPGFDVMLNRMRGVPFKEVTFPVGTTPAKLTITRIAVYKLPC